MIAHVGTPHYRAALRHGAGLLSDGIEVTVGFKIGDIDPRGERADPTTVSDKARAIGGAVLEAMMHLAQRR